MPLLGHKYSQFEISEETVYHSVCRLNGFTVHIATGCACGEVEHVAAVGF